MQRPSAPPPQSPQLREFDDDRDYRPWLFRLQNLPDREQCRELGRQSSVRIHDTFLAQLDGLIRSRNPARRLTDHQLELERARYCAGRANDEMGVWVYYPWQRSLVHLLDEPDFVELRTSRNRNKITREEQAGLNGRSVGVIGLSVGGQVAMALATERVCGELRLADFDTLELSNLNRLRESVRNLGLPKTTLVARDIAELDPFLKVVCFDQGLTSTNLEDFLTGGGRVDLLVDECDGLAMKVRARERARELRIPVVMEANDRATLDVERFDRDPERPLLHGLLGGLDLSGIEQLTTSEEKVPFLMPMVGEATMSDKLRASLLEIGQTLETWPQLASDVCVGAGLVTHVVRRILLDQFNDSGRYFVDLEDLVKDRRGDTDVGVKPPPPSSALAARLARQLPSSREAGQVRLDRTLVDALLHAAILAPSGANEQPWAFDVRDDNLWLLADNPFGDSLLNFKQIATRLALGTASENVVLKAHQLGLDVKVTPPEHDAARVCFSFFESGTRQEGLEAHSYDALSRYIEERCTNRRRIAPEPISDEALHALRVAAESSKACNLQLVTDAPAIAEAADIIARAERIRMLHPTGHHDLVNEIRWTAEEAQQTRDGIDLETIDLTPSEAAGLRLLRPPGVPRLLRRWKGGRGLEKLSREALLASSAIGVLSAPSCSELDLYQAGRALQRCWLAATQHRLSLQPHTAAPYLIARACGGGASAFDPASLGELYSLHARLRAVFGPREHDVFLFRLFPGCPPPKRSLRREPTRLSS